MNDEEAFPAFFSMQDIDFSIKLQKFAQRFAVFFERRLHTQSEISPLTRQTTNKFTVQISAHKKTGQRCLFLLLENFCEQNSFVSSPDLWTINGASPHT